MLREIDSSTSARSRSSSAARSVLADDGVRFSFSSRVNRTGLYLAAKIELPIPDSGVGIWMKNLVHPGIVYRDPLRCGVSSNLDHGQAELRSKKKFSLTEKPQSFL